MAGLKASDDFEFSQEWWKKGKPLTLKSTGLGKTLKAYEALKTSAADLARKGNYKGFTGTTLPFDAAVKMIKGEIEKAVNEAKKECNKTLHKDCLAVLGKFSAAAVKEASHILRMQENFEKAYGKLLTGLQKRAGEQMDAVNNLKTEGHTAFKQAEKDAKDLEALVKKTVASQKTGTGTRQAMVNAIAGANRLMRSLERSCEQVTEAKDSAEEVKREISKVVNDGYGLLHDYDYEKLTDKRSELLRVQDNVREYENKSRAFLTGAQTNFKDLELSTDNSEIDLDGMKELTKDGAAAITDLQEDARRHANVLTIWLTTIDGMKKAKAAAKNGKTIEEAAKEKGVSIPPAEWKTRVESWVVIGEKTEKKLKKLVPQAEAVYKPLEAKLTDEFKKDKNIKDDCKVMEKCIEKIGSYVKDVAAWLAKLKTSANEVAV